jgi:hypothetical protein
VWKRVSGLVAVGALFAVCAAACSTTSAPDAGHRATASLAIPSLATSIETSAGSWAVVPMGHLDQPLNTFWQLFFRPRGATRWSDRASVLAVATKGGLVVATADGGSLAVGVRPANLLVFSPLMITSNGGRSWSAEPPVAALADQPDSLAIGAGDRALALTTSRSGTNVLESTAGLAGWHNVTTTTGLGASPPGRACGLASMAAVSLVGGSPVIGADCARRGIVGIFSETHGAWHLVGPKLPQSLEDGRAAVLGLQPSSGGLGAILSVVDGQGTSLLAAWTTDGGLHWRVSPPLQLGSRQVRSFGQDDGAGFFVLVSGTTSSEAVDVLSGPNAVWDRLPTPPAGTATVAFGPAGRVDALVSNDTVFTDWKLAAGSTSWTRSQVVNVPIQFGSSS